MPSRRSHTLEDKAWVRMLRIEHQDEGETVCGVQSIWVQDCSGGLQRGIHLVRTVGEELHHEIPEKWEPWVAQKEFEIVL